MKIEISFLRSKVARRIFLLFILSSLLPVLLLAFLSIRQVDIFTTNQQHEYLKEISKNYGLSLLDRLLFLKTKICSCLEIFCFFCHTITVIGYANLSF